MRVNKLPEAEFFELNTKVHNTFEKVRKDIYELMMEESIPDATVAKEIMQKAYCTFATIASKGINESEEAQRSRWADLVNEAANKHGRYCQDMKDGIFYPNIEIDPRLSKAPDEKTDLSGLPGYKQR